jgi:hypothetical protein
MMLIRYILLQMKPMPFELIRKISIFENNFDLKNFFGFLKWNFSFKRYKNPITSL